MVNCNLLKLFFNNKMGVLILKDKTYKKMKTKIKILMIKALQSQKVHFQRKKLQSLKLIQFGENPPEKNKIIVQNYARLMVYLVIGVNFAKEKECLWKMFYKKMRKIGF